MISCPKKFHIDTEDKYTLKPLRHEQFLPESYSVKLKFVRNDTIQERFKMLSQIWHEEMDGVSSVQLKISHLAYQEVIQMGEAVVPYILDEIKENGGGGWFIALAKILKHNPVPDEHKRDMDLIIDDWLRYAKKLRLDS